MYKFHKDKKKYFDFQYKTAKDYIIPYLEEQGIGCEGIKVMEVGCGEAGVLKAFLEKSCRCTGIELSESRVQLAKSFLHEFLEKGDLVLDSQNIFDFATDPAYRQYFDLILLKDVIEHIPNQENLIQGLAGLLRPGGNIFISFPPWWMPFGGHQQICRQKFLKFLPYFHLMPRAIYRSVLEIFGERQLTVKELLELKETGLTIEQFEKIVIKAGCTISHRRLYLFNPIYRYKFGISPRRLRYGFDKTPFVRNFYTTCAYYIIRKFA